MASPLASLPLINAVVLAVHEIAKKQLGLHDDNNMTLWEGLLCGAIAGFINCLLVTPSELIKCRLQIEYETSKFNHQIYYMIKKVYKEESIRGLFRGNVATIFREIPAYAGQFGGYYYAKKFFARLKNKKVEDLKNIELMFSGAIGGYFCWQLSYPQDVIKTFLQLKTNHFKSRYYDGGVYECAKYIYKIYGIMGFWKGYLPCTIRALLANSVLFLTYENIKYFIREN